jgi:polar amino acid transport system ATP-binding protein
MEQGEVVSIIGASGSGKTTLLRAMNFLIPVDGGEMKLDGVTLIDDTTNQQNENKLREKRLNFGLVFQSFNLFPQYNVKRNIMLAPELLLKQEIKALKRSLKEQKTSRKEIKERLKNALIEGKERIEREANELIEKTGLTNKINSYPCELSGGQCQRVAIARALALKPKILCFDEPTSALDPELTGEVLKVIKALRDEGRTMIIVTHEMGFAKNVSDKIVYMADGVIEEMGTPKQILEKPKSEKLKTFLSSVSNKDAE